MELNKESVISNKPVKKKLSEHLRAHIALQLVKISSLSPKTYEEYVYDTVLIESLYRLCDILALVAYDAQVEDCLILLRKRLEDNEILMEGMNYGKSYNL